MSAPIPVYRPRLPEAKRLLPYLDRIDASRVYTNWGPLATELEERLARHLGLREPTVVSASSGTAALIGAILAVAGRATVARPVAIVPGFTFVAAASAVEQCGYQPYVVDIDEGTWLLDLDRLVEHPILDRVGLVVVTAAFGRPVSQETCRSFRRQTGVAVVIDGGASFESIEVAPDRYAGEVPVALSFHATKSFSTGEGGGVVTTDGALAAAIVRALNFGFYGTRNSASASTNGKLSEYHAAVGLAELDDWPAKREALTAVARRYRRGFETAGVGRRFFGAPDVAGCYALFDAGDAARSDSLRRRLSRSEIEFRLWYGTGLLDHEHFRGLPHDRLEVTARLAPRLIGLPTAPDLDDAAVDRVVDTLTRETAVG